MKKIRILANAVKTRQNYFNKKIVLDNKPNLLWIEPTNFCNLNCIMCPNDQIPKHLKGFMDFELYKKIIDEVKSYVSSIYLLVGGESLLHPKIYEMISYARQNGIRPLLNTNATVLTKEATDKMLKSGIAHITFAFDGYNKKNYEKIRRNANFDKTLENIRFFLRERKKMKGDKPFIAVTTIILGNEKYTKRDVQKFYRYFKDLGVDEFIVKRPNSWGNKFKDTKTFEPIREGSQFHPCSHLWSTSTILWNGKVVPCCFDFQAEYELGDIKKQKLLSIWNSKKMTTLRRAMLNGTYLKHNKLCDGCAILWADKSMGLPAGLRASIADAVTYTTGFWLEKWLIQAGGLFNKNAGLKISRSIE